MSARFETSDLVFAVVTVAGATAACAVHGDVPTVEVLTDHYNRVAAAIRKARGRVIKVIGDGVIAAFPVAMAAGAVKTLRDVQHDGTERWQRFDSRCRVQIKIGAGSLVTASLGPAGQEREDIYGDALNRLFKMAAGDFVLSPEMSALAGASSEET